MQVKEKIRTGVSARFIGANTNRIDAKGRVSVPAEFRKQLAADGAMICYPAFTGQVLDCGSEDLLDTLMGMIANLDVFDEQRRVLELSITSESQRLIIDGDGRILLPQELRDHAGLTDKACFVGFGGRFQIWQPEAHKQELIAARKAAQENLEILKARALPSTSQKNANQTRPIRGESDLD
jgi:transcriptional regulator MraZ